jgi:hypothetical protein
MSIFLLVYWSLLVSLCLMPGMVWCLTAFIIYLLLLLKLFKYFIALTLFNKYNLCTIKFNCLDCAVECFQYNHIGKDSHAQLASTCIRCASVLVNFMYHNTPNIWSNIILIVSARVFLNQISIWISRMSKDIVLPGDWKWQLR